MTSPPVSPGTQPPATLVLSLRGAPRWQRPDGRQGPLGRLDAALLALVTWSGEFPRDRAAAWLWPTVPLKTAQTNLRQRVFKLRQVTGHGVVDTGALLRPAPGTVADLPATSVEAALDDGELLAGYDYGDLEALDEWLHGAREQLRHARADALAARAAAREAQGALAAAIDDCRQLLALAPTQERGWRQLMRLHYLRGDRSAAIATFERFEQQVCRELGLMPADETLTLLHTIERARDAAPAGRGPLPAALVRPPALIGRDEAWTAVQAAWDAGRAVLLLGEGGIGKSRLMADLMQPLPGVEHTVLRLSARPGDAAAPYATLAPLLSQALQRCSVQALTDAERAELARVLPALGEAPAAPARQPALWQAAESLLKAVVRQGLQRLAVDDLHHADVATLEFLRWAMASADLAGLRWLLAARPDEPVPAAAVLQQWLGDSLRIEPVRLRAFDDQQMHALLRTLALPDWPADDAERRRTLMRHAGGHPFFTLETLKAHWLQAGSADGALPLPAAAGAMLARRIGQLTAPALRLLQWLALAPGALRPSLVAGLWACPADAVAQAWSELEATQLAQGAWPTHELVREQVLAMWPAAARAPVARQLAQALQHHAGVGAARLVSLWQQADEPHEAAQALMGLAAAAGRAGRLAEHAALLRQAAQSWQRAGHAGAAFDAELLAAHDGLLLDGAPATLQRCTGLLARADTPLRRAAVRALQANALLNDARFVEARASAEDALSEAPADSAVAQDAATLHGRALALTGDAERAVHALQGAAARADAADDTPRALAAHGALAHALQVAGHYGRAVQHQQQAHRLALRLGDPTEVAQSGCNLATLLAYRGQPQAALLAARDADQRLHALGVADAHWVFNRMTWARCAAHLGLLAEALAALDLALAGAEGVGASMATLLRIQRFSVLDWLGRGDPASLPQAPDQLATLAPLARAGVLLAMHRLLRERRADTDERAPVEAALHRLAGMHPALRDDPVLAREWCRIDPAAEAEARLARLADRARAAGADGLARSLLLVRVDRLAERSLPQARALARQLWAQMHEGLHPATLLPQAWHTLGRVLPRPEERRQAQAETESWLQAALLPPDVARADFLRRHAAWRGAAPATAPDRATRATEATAPARPAGRRAR